jgi:hypothetical protein
MIHHVTFTSVTLSSAIAYFPNHTFANAIKGQVVGSWGRRKAQQADSDVRAVSGFLAYQ